METPSSYPHWEAAIFFSDNTCEQGGKPTDNLDNHCHLDILVMDTQYPNLVVFLAHNVIPNKPSGVLVAVYDIQL